MSTTTQDSKASYDPRTVFNVPNQLTSIRLVLAIVLFGLVPYEHYLAAMWVFIVAAGTDWIDGFYARRYNQVTTLGRILDPFVDKIIICGTFISLAGIDGSGIARWMAVVVVGRELLVTALRSFLEQQGADFSATLSGKLKMVLQCIAVVLSLYRLSYGAAPIPDWLHPGLMAAVWSAVVLTVLSGVAYVFAAAKLLRLRV
ncbi:MAG TPA: CDP-diacylglycerol--glycerol-3-phosphate 3-phosphatidyltransferase [Pirellulales bacterium]|nr:CDP-diacylglycerol--glycerol-3-phosphate 3-phosphatidyltransferase [Pirellulales bacterium]